MLDLLVTSIKSVTSSSNALESFKCCSCLVSRFFFAHHASLHCLFIRNLTQGYTIGYMLLSIIFSEPMYRMLALVSLYRK